MTTPMRSRVKTLTQLSLFTALAMIFSYLETLLPLGLPLPGFKLGLCNVVVLYTAYTLGLPYAAALSFVRVFLSSLLFGSVTSFFFSLGGAFLSFLALVFTKKCLFGRVSFIGISVLSASAFNLGQLLIAACLYASLAVLGYLPALLLASALLGSLIGLLLNLTFDRLPHRFLTP